MKLRELIFVDDDRAVNFLHEKIAEKLDIAENVRAFSDVTGLVSYLESLEAEGKPFPEIILIDLYMPNASGHDLVRQIQEFSSYDPDKTILAYLSKTKYTLDLLEADDLDIEYYLVKPLKPEDLEELRNIYEAQFA